SHQLANRKRATRWLRFGRGRGHLGKERRARGPERLQLLFATRVLKTCQLFSSSSARSSCGSLPTSPIVPCDAASSAAPSSSPSSLIGFGTGFRVGSALGSRWFS